MSENLLVVYIARHGNPAWTQSSQQIELTDLPLTPEGERRAARRGERLAVARIRHVTAARKEQSLGFAENVFRQTPEHAPDSAQ